MTASPPKQGKKLDVPCSKPATARATKAPPLNVNHLHPPRIPVGKASFFLPPSLSTTASPRHRPFQTIALRGRIHTDITFDCPRNVFAFFFLSC